MFNPYGFQGGTATLDPQATGMNGHARIAEAMSGFAPNISNPQNLTGVNFGQPATMTGPTPNFAPFGYGYPTPGLFTPNTGIPGFGNVPMMPPIPSYATPFGCATTPVNPWIQPTINPFLNYAPTGWVNPSFGVPTVNPFVPTTFTNSFGTPSIPFAGYPFPQSPAFVSGYNPAWPNPMLGGFNAIPATTPHPFYGIATVPQTPYINTIPGIRSNMVSPVVNGWINPLAAAYGNCIPTMAHPFFSHTAGLSGLVNPFVASSPFNVPVGSNPVVANPLVVSQLANQCLAAGIDPVTTCTIVAAQCGCSPSAILPTILGNINPCGPIGTVSPYIYGRLGIQNALNFVNPYFGSLYGNTWGGTPNWNNPFSANLQNSTMNPLFNNFSSPLSYSLAALNTLNAIPGICGPLGCTTPGSVTPFGISPNSQSFPLNVPFFGAQGWNSGFGSCGFNPILSGLQNTNTCGLSYCI